MGMRMEQNLRRLSSIKAVAELIGCRPDAMPSRRTTPWTARVYAAGYGSIARPMCDALADFGLCRFVLVDPKRYWERSVASQCAPRRGGSLQGSRGC